MSYSIKDLTLVTCYGLTIGGIVSYLVFASIRFGFAFRLTSIAILIFLFLINVKRIKTSPSLLRIFGIGLATFVFAVPVLGLLGSIWIFVSEDYYTGFYETIILYISIPIVAIGMTAVFVVRFVFFESEYSKRLDQMIEGLRLLIGLKKN